MINSISLKNFKCFNEKTNFAFSKLNLLTGLNGRGKSTVLQSLLVLAQTVNKHALFNPLEINGEFVSLGNFDDIKNSETSRSEKIVFEFDFNDSVNSIIEYSENPDNQLSASCNFPKEKLMENLKFKDILHNVHYISADRLGPTKYVEKKPLPSFLNVGPRGEHSINILASSTTLDISVDKRLYRGNDSNSIIQQTAEWMSYILDGANLEVKGREIESSVLYLLLNNKNNSYKYKPSNVGFGYSYILPLVLSGLIARPGHIIIVENPEAHLHPRAQSRIAEFFAIVASTGVQIFIESHSEHILNGFRVSALQSKIDISFNDIIFHYFNESFTSQQLLMDEKAKIENWPTGFFDQQEIDLSDIFKLTR